VSNKLFQRYFSPSRYTQHKILFTLYLFVLAYAVFTPKDKYGSGWFSLLGDSKILEPLVNLLLLVPMAYFLGKFQDQWKLLSKLIFIFLTSITIESIQFLIPGRVSDIRDIVLNSLGGLIFLTIQKKLVKN